MCWSLAGKNLVSIQLYLVLALLHSYGDLSLIIIFLSLRYPHIHVLFVAGIIAARMANGEAEILCILFRWRIEHF